MASANIAKKKIALQTPPTNDPKFMVPANEAAEYCNIEVELLNKWTASGHAPHYFIGEKGPLYKKTELREWIGNNIIERKGGMPIPQKLQILVPPDRLHTFQPPTAIASLQGLCWLNTSGMVSGIYFLCHSDEVVYVGQSVKLIARIAQHIAEGKKAFDDDRVFFIPCPLEDLDRMEEHFIDTLKPRYNGTHKHGGKRCPDGRYLSISEDAYRQIVEAYNSGT